VQRTVAIDAKRDHGYAGLTVNSVAQDNRNVAKREDCAEVQGAKRKTSQRLAFGHVQDEDAGLRQAGRGEVDFHGNAFKV